MQGTKVNFQNANGEKLSAYLQMPIDQHPHTFALFAHCFTCSKNFSAVRNISRAMSMEGIAVLRFDFTGLGESEGDFEDTNFSTNIDDLIAAASFLETEYKAPSLLVGHSLGGAAVLFAASQLDSVKAVATIGAPADPKHVRHLLKDGLEDIQCKGTAMVNIGGRPFTMKKHFLEDLQNKDLQGIIHSMDKALLVLHSPQDEVVEVDNARKIYEAAFHPKSFISLDGADHLLGNSEDSEYAGYMIAHWARRYLIISEEKLLKSEAEVTVRLADEGYTTDIKAGRHMLTSDEPLSVGGNDFGPSPYDFLSAALGACTAMTLKMYAQRKGWPLEEVRVDLSYNKIHAEDCEQVQDPSCRIDRFERKLKIKGDLNAKQIDRLLQIADKCPVHKTLQTPAEIITRLSDK